MHSFDKHIALIIIRPSGDMPNRNKKRCLGKVHIRFFVHIEHNECFRFKNFIYDSNLSSKTCSRAQNRDFERKYRF